MTVGPADSPDATTPAGTPAATGPARAAEDPQADRPSARAATAPLARLLHGAALVKATAFDLAILAGHLLLYPTGILPARTAAPSPKTPAIGRAPGGALRLPTEGRAHPPVVMLHGFVDNRSVFTLLRRSLLHHGWTRVDALNYSPLTCDIRGAAELLGRHVERICAESGHSRVDLVGHSLGGLIARYYVQRLGGDARVRTLVTLGTPHTGTRVVPLLTPLPIVRQMRPGSALLEELSQPARGCGTRFVSFWSDLDQLMVPVAAARLEHPDLSAENIRVSGIGHLALPVHRGVAAEIRQALSGKELWRGAIDAA
ncbi:esterase/lipase family protein [Streptomyces sp. NPDC008079]|uniref:alpha/beta fold hydrolase n=1 Tax=Streptomyces sp. NPDC008079 TaxID=3364806 RepID=UPI0036EA67EE